MRSATTAAFLLTALSLLACSGFVDNLVEKASQDPQFAAQFAESFQEKFQPECVKGMMAQGVEAIDAQAGCLCVSNELVQRTPVELVALATHPDDPKSEQIMQAAYAQCGVQAPE